MSLILDALRKLERDKNAPEPGVVVVGSVPWGEGRSRRSLVPFVAATLLAVLAGGFWLARKPPGPKPVTPPTAIATPPPAPALDAPPAAPSPSASGGPSPIAAAPSPRPIGLPAPAAASDRPAGAPPSTSDDVRLTAISRKDGRPVALINDRLVFEGDAVDGIKVLRIGEAEVEVEIQGKRRVLRF